MEVLAGGQIRALTFSSGNAGAVDVETGDLLMRSDGVTTLLTAISSSAASDATGNAGTVRVVADGQIEVADGAQIPERYFRSGRRRHGPGRGGRPSDSRCE